MNVREMGKGEHGAQLNKRRIAGRLGQSLASITPRRLAYLGEPKGETPRPALNFPIMTHANRPRPPSVYRLAQRSVDLTVVNIIAPQLTDPPALNQGKGMMRIKGCFPSQPVQINFEMLYQAVNGRWRLFVISVQPGTPPSPARNAGAPATNAAERR